jgi:hypothetical protein
MSGKAAAVGLIGVGIGTAIGYFLPPLIMPKPKITISPSPVVSGQLVTFAFTGFPPLTQIVTFGEGTNGIASSATVAGTTDAAGNLTISAAAPTLPSGTVILYVAMAANNPTVYAAGNYIAA